MRFFNSKLCIFANIFNSWLTTSCSIRQMTLPYDLTHELDLGFSISNFQIAVFQELMGLPIYLNLFRDDKENDRKSCELWHGKDYKYIYVYFSSSVGHPGLLCSQTNLVSLQWRHNGSYSVSNHQPHDCLINRLIRRRSKKTLKLRVTGVCVGNSPGTGEFSAQMASNAENFSIWWRHHVIQYCPNRVDTPGMTPTDFSHSL